MMINKYKNIIGFFTVILFLGGCKTAKESYYSYSVDTYTIDTADHFLYFSSLLSYGDYLFEYKITTHFNTMIYGDDKSIKSVVYDTSGIYLLCGKSKQYCEFDSFGMQSKIIKKGAISDKPTGANVSPIVKTDSSSTYYAPPKEVLINNIQCYYSDIVFKNKALKDTMEQGAILIKKEDFNSLYKIRGLEFPDKEYCIIGFRMSFLSKTTYFLEQIKNLRLLTEKEKLICKNLVRASGL